MPISLRTRSVGRAGVAGEGADPGRAVARTSMVQTSVPAVTSAGALGSPRVTTWSSSCPVTVSTVNCQSPAQSGPVRTWTRTFAGSTPARPRNSCSTRCPVGPLRQAVATSPASGVGVTVPGDGAVAGGVAGAVLGPVVVGAAVWVGDAVGSPQPGWGAAAGQHGDAERRTAIGRTRARSRRNAVGWPAGSRRWACGPSTAVRGTRGGAG